MTGGRGDGLCGGDVSVAVWRMIEEGRTPAQYPHHPPPPPTHPPLHSPHRRLHHLRHA